MTLDEYLEKCKKDLEEFKKFMEANYPELNNLEIDDWEEQFWAFLAIKKES